MLWKEKEKSTGIQLGIEPRTFRSLVGCSYHWATGPTAEIISRQLSAVTQHCNIRRCRTLWDEPEQGYYVTGGWCSTSSQTSSYMHIHFTIPRGLSKCFCFALNVKCVKMKRRPMHVYTIIMHNSARSQDKGFMPAVYGSISIELGAEESIICVNLHLDLNVKYMCTNLKSMCNLPSIQISGKWLQANRHVRYKHTSAMQSRWCGARSGSPQLLLHLYLASCWSPPQFTRQGQAEVLELLSIYCGLHYNKMIQYSSSFSSTVCCHLPLDSLIPWPYVRVGHHISERIQPLNGTQHTINRLQGRRERNNTHSVIHTENKSGLTIIL